MSKVLLQRRVQGDTTFGSLLRELQNIWDEVGETESEMEKMLHKLEQECLEVYRRKVKHASEVRAYLHQSIAEKEGELGSLFAELGEHPALTKADKKRGTLKEQLTLISPQLEELRLKKEERIKQFMEVKAQIQTISAEISGSFELSESQLLSREDLTVRKLDDHHAQLQALQKEKSERLHKVLECVNVVHELCAVLGLDFYKTITEIHPTLSKESGANQSKSISNGTLESLSSTIQSLMKEKQQRLEMLRTLATSLKELWKLMDTPHQEQAMFCHVVDCLSASDFAPGGLSLEVIDNAKKEVKKLEFLKASKMKELVLKKRMELEDVCRWAHMEPDASTAPDKTNAMIDSGMVDASELLTNLEEQIIVSKEEALSRKEILSKVAKWLAACKEESWLEDYSMDENRYHASKGAHINLKRAERARITVNKLPALMDALTAKTRAWEAGKGACFLFDGVRLLSMLDDYTFNRHEREEEKRRMRDQKRLQEQVLTQRESFYGSRPATPIKCQYSSSSPALFNGRAAGGGGFRSSSTPGTLRRLLLVRPGTPEFASTPPTPSSSTPRGHHANHKQHALFARNSSRPSVAALNFVAMHKDDATSIAPATVSDSTSPLATAYA